MKPRCTKDLLEAACRVGQYGINNFVGNGFNATNVKRMAIAIMNSDSHTPFVEKYNCKDTYSVRYGIGLEAASHRDISSFGSHKNYHNYVSK